MKRYLPIFIVLVVLAMYQKFASKEDVSTSGMHTDQVRQKSSSKNKTMSHLSISSKQVGERSFESHSLKAAPDVASENPYGPIHQKLFDNDKIKKIIFPLGKNAEELVKTDFIGQDVSREVNTILNHTIDCLKTNKCAGDPTIEKGSRLENRMMLEALLLYNSSYAHGDTHKKLSYKTLMQLLEWGDSQIKDISLNYLITQHSNQLSLKKVLPHFSGEDILSVYKNIHSREGIVQTSKYYAGQGSEDLFYVAQGIDHYVKDPSTLSPLLKELCSTVTQLSNAEIKARVLSKLNQASESLLQRVKACP